MSLSHPAIYRLLDPCDVINIAISCQSMQKRKEKKKVQINVLPKCRRTPWLIESIHEMIVPVAPFPHEVESSGIFVVDNPDEDESIGAQFWHG